MISDMELKLRDFKILKVVAQDSNMRWLKPLNGSGFPPALPQPETQLDEAWGDTWRGMKGRQKQQPGNE